VRGHESERTALPTRRPAVASLGHSTVPRSRRRPRARRSWMTPNTVAPSLNGYGRASCRRPSSACCGTTRKASRKRSWSNQATRKSSSGGLGTGPRLTGPPDWTTTVDPRQSEIRSSSVFVDRFKTRPRFGVSTRSGGHSLGTEPRIGPVVIAAFRGTRDSTSLPITALSFAAGRSPPDVL
jgi:hypothetical protein